MVVWSRNLCGKTNILGSIVFVLAIIVGNFASAQGNGGNNNNNLGNFGFNRVVGGVHVDATGVLTGEWQTLSNQELDLLRNGLKNGDPRLQKAGYRGVSLKAIEKALAAVEKGTAISPELQFMAGLTRIEFVVAKPESGDLILIGPGEGWTVDKTGRVVGEKSGEPILLLEDFVVAMRSVEKAASDFGISVDIRPTPEGQKEGLRITQEAQRIPRWDSEVQSAIERATGEQPITLTGVPKDSHYAQVLVSADYQMKRLSMGFDQAPISRFPSMLELLKQRGGLTSSINPRFWMECNYDAIGKSEDGLTWKIQGQGVKTMTEETYNQNTNVSDNKKPKSNATAEKWAGMMTERFEELRKANPVFTELRNVMDMSVVAALIANENLFNTAKLSAPVLTNDNSAFKTPAWQTPVGVPSKCSFIQNVDSSFTITTSGGVQVDSWKVARNQEVDKELSAKVSKMTEGLNFDESLFCNLTR